MATVFLVLEDWPRPGWNPHICQLRADDEQLGLIPGGRPGVSVFDAQLLICQLRADDGAFGGLACGDMSADR